MSSMASTAAEPSRNLGWRVVVKGTRKWAPSRILPKPATDMSSGILKAMAQQRLRAADGHDIVDRLDGSGIGGFADHLQGRLGTVLNRPAGLKHEPIVHLQAGFAQGPAIALEAFLGPGRGEGARQERNALVSQFEQVLCNGVTGQEVIGLDVDELAAKGGGMAEQDGGDAAGKQLLVNGRLGGHAIDREQ